MQQVPRETWAYQAMRTGEARQCGGRVWNQYDATFYQQSLFY